MALNEPILPGTTNLVAGQRVVLGNTQAVYVVPSNQTAAAVTASLPGNPVIRACDYASRYGGVFLAAGQGGVGKDIFET